MRIVTSGLKSHPLSIELPKLALITAGNGGHKTAIIDAINFAVLGYVPRLGKEPARTAKIMSASAREMRVQLTRDNGTQITRTLTRKADGGFSREVRASWVTSKSEDEHQAAIFELFGGSAVEAEEALNITGLIRLPENQRQARLQSLIERGQDTDAISVAVAKRWTQILADVEDARVPPDFDDPAGGSQKIPGYIRLRPLINGYSDNEALKPHTGQYACAVYMADELWPKIKHGGIAGALTWANEEKKNASASLTKKKQARKELSESLEAMPAPDAGEIDRLAKRVAELDQQIGAAEERAQATARAAKLLSDAKLHQGAAGQVLFWAIVDRVIFEDEQAQLPTWRAQLPEIIAALDALTAPTLPDFSEAERSERQATDADEAAAAVIIPDALDLAPLSQAVLRASGALLLAKQSPWARAAEIAAALNLEAVALGKNKNLVVKTASAHIVEYATELSTLASTHGAADVEACTADLKRADAALANAERDANVSSTARTAALARRTALQDEGTKARGAAKDLRAKLTETYEQERALYQQRQAELTTERDRLRPLVDGATTREQSTAEAVRDAAQILIAAQQRVADLLSTPMPSGTASLVADLTTERTAAATRLSTLNATQATRDKFEELVREIDALMAAEVVCKALEKALQRVRSEEITQGAEPLLSIVRDYLKGAGRSESPRLLGWERAGEPIDIEAFSGGEFALFALGFVAAVDIRRGISLRLLLSEAAEADAETLAQIMMGISAIGDRLTGAIIASPHEPARIPPNWVQMTPTGERIERGRKAA